MGRALASLRTSLRLRSSKRMIHGAPLLSCLGWQIPSLIMRRIVEERTASAAPASLIVTPHQSVLTSLAFEIVRNLLGH